MLGEAVANIILNIVLCKFFGVTGIILATVFSVFTSNMILFPRVIFREYFKNGKIGEYRMDHLLYALTMFFAAGISFLFCRVALPLCMIDRSNLLMCILCLGGRLLICSSIWLLVAWLLWHRTERYKNAVAWIRGVIRKKA